MPASRCKSRSPLTSEGGVTVYSANRRIRAHRPVCRVELLDQLDTSDVRMDAEFTQPAPDARVRPCFINMEKRFQFTMISTG